MGQVKISVFGCIVSLVLLIQLGLHTKLLQRKPGVIESGNLTDEFIDQYADTSPFAAVVSSSNDKILPTTSSNTRNKRFLLKTSSTTEGRSSQNYDSSGDGTAAGLNSDEEFVLNVPNANVNSVALTIGEQDPWEGVSPHLRIRNFYTGNFIFPNTQLCNKKGSNLTLVVLIPSAVANFQQRKSVRRTWGSFSLRKDVAVGFVIGDPKLNQINESVMESFQQEKDLFGDIIIADFKDTYKNLTLKTLYMLEWASTYCSSAKFFMKTDDDVFLNIPLVLRFISTIRESDRDQPKIYGNVFSGHLPQRNATHKHYVSTTVYPHNVHYPNFTSGPSYLISAAVLRPLLKEATRLPLFNLEDVFLTGFAASALDIPRVNVTRFRNELENPFNMSVCQLFDTIAGMTDGSSGQIYHVWYNYLMGSVLCRKTRNRYSVLENDSYLALQGEAKNNHV